MFKDQFVWLKFPFFSEHISILAQVLEFFWPTTWYLLRVYKKLGFFKAGNWLVESVEPNTVG